MLYEALTGARPFAGDDEADTLLSILIGDPDPPTARVPGLPASIDALVAQALARDRDARYAGAAEMHDAVERALPPASPREVAVVVERFAGAKIAETRAEVRALLDAEIASTVAARAPARDEAGPPPSPRGPTRVEGLSSRSEVQADARGPVRLGVVLAVAAVIAVALFFAGSRAREAGAVTPAPLADGSARRDPAPIAPPPAPSAAPVVTPDPTPTATATVTSSAPPVRPSIAPPARPKPAATASELHPNPYAAPR
ncbi:MAG: hypothetical protein QM820_50375 [Minicystis sp.]